MSIEKTPNYNLNKPGYDNFGDVADLNENADIIDAALNTIATATQTKVDKEAGKGLSESNFTSVEKLKLNGLFNYDDTVIRALLTGHEGEEVGTSEGVHGLRWYNDELQFHNGLEWIEIETGGGGLLPFDVVNPSLEIGNTQLTIRWTDPDDITIEGIVVSTWAGTKLVRKAGSFPTSPSDGVVLVDNKVRGAYASAGYVDSGLTNETIYYYQLFPYNTTKGVNKNPTNRLSGAPQPYRIFGVSIDLENTNPETAVTYTDDAVGITPGTAWNTMPIFKDIKPCVLKNGVVQYYLNPADLSKKADGTASDITSGNAGDVMIEIPKTGFKITTVGNTLTIKVTDNPNDTANFKYYAHTRAAEGDRSKLYIGAYLGFETGGKLRSLSGKTPTARETIGAFRTLAKANGAGYDIVSFYPLTLLQCLFMIKYKNMDSQTALGRGYVDGNSSYIATGGTNAKGMNFGETSGTLQMKLFGLEDFWGNRRQWIDGLYCNASYQILTAFQNFNDTGSGYTNRGSAGISSNISGYMSKIQGTTETGFVAKECSGSETTHWADSTYLYAGCLPVFGGSRSDGSGAGAFCLPVADSAHTASENIGARLMYL